MRFFFVVHNAASVANVIQLLLMRNRNSRAITLRINREFAKAHYAEREPRLFVSGAKNRSIMTRVAAKVT